MIDNVIEQNIIKDLRLEAAALDIPSGAADSFIIRALTDAKKTLKTKKIITNNDLERAIVKELKKYNDNLAYVYKNRDKII